MQAALSFPEMVDVKYLSFVYLVRENSASEKPSQQKNKTRHGSGSFVINLPNSRNHPSFNYFPYILKKL